MTTARIIDVLPAGSLTLSTMKEQLSIAYIEMLTAAAGCTVVDPKVDFDAIDMSIRSSVEYSHRLGPQLDVQLKCTSQAVIRQNHISWRIDERTHKLLTSKKRSAPIILALLIVPSDHNTWLDHNEARLLTESTMYWIAGVDIPVYPAGQETMTVEIPRENRLTRESLLGIMHEIGEGSPGWRI